MAEPLKQPSGGEFGDEKEAAEVPAWFLQYFHAVTKSPMSGFAKPFETWMIDKVATSGFDLPISQVVGFQQFTIKSADRVEAVESTTSTSWTDLATVGPQLTGLSDGVYLVLYGALVANAGNSGYMGVGVNGANPATGATQQGIAINSYHSVSSAAVVTLDTGGNNTLLVRYTVDAATTGQFGQRWMHALRTQNA